MAVAPIGGGYAPAPYEIGASDFTGAQSILDKLDSLKVTKNDYKDAMDDGLLHSWFGDKDEKQKLIDQQTHLEDDALNHLYSIAAANERGQVSPTLLAQAQHLASGLDSRIWQDEENASAAARDLGGDLPSGTSERDTKSIVLRLALAQGSEPDVIALSDTASFKDQVNALDRKIRADVDAYQHGATQTDRDAAKAQLLGPDDAKLNDLHDKLNRQTGVGSQPWGIDFLKISELPDGDPQKSAYIQQSKDLLALVNRGGALFDDRGLLDSVQAQ
jgi:hypothetical protein